MLSRCHDTIVTITSKGVGVGGMLEVKNLSKQFDGNYVLKNINLKIREGEVYGIIGANG